MSERAVEFIVVPKGTRASRCRGSDCGETIYWVERPRAGKAFGMTRVPISCDVPGGDSPDSFTDGKGVNHFTNCPNAGNF